MDYSFSLRMTAQDSIHNTMELPIFFPPVAMEYGANDLFGGAI